jgi:hypothetical protein
MPKTQMPIERWTEDLVMSIAPFAGTPGPVPVNGGALQRVPTLSAVATEQAPADLTIHRITETHHGRTLLTLGHAAEYLADSRRFLFPETSTEADDEAIHILMELSSHVFTEYAEQKAGGKRQLEEKLVGWVTHWFDKSKSRTN